MKKKQYEIFENQDASTAKKALLFSGAYILIALLLLVLLFFVPGSFFLWFILYAVIMFALYQFVFYQHIIFIMKRNDYERIKLTTTFELSEEKVAIFDEHINDRLYDLDFDIVSKNEVYVLSRIEFVDTIYSIGLGVYFIENKTEAVSPTFHELSLELSSYQGNGTLVKVILLVAETFDEDTLYELQYNSAVGRNAVLVGVEKSSKKLYYNYFLNGEEIDEYFSEFFEVDVTRKVEEEESIE